MSCEESFLNKVESNIESQSWREVWRNPGLLRLLVHCSLTNVNNAMASSEPFEFGSVRKKETKCNAELNNKKEVLTLLPWIYTVDLSTTSKNKTARTNRQNMETKSPLVWHRWEGWAEKMVSTIEVGRITSRMFVGRRLSIPSKLQVLFNYSAIPKYVIRLYLRILWFIYSDKLYSIILSVS